MEVLNKYSDLHNFGLTVFEFLNKKKMAGLKLINKIKINCLTAERIMNDLLENSVVIRRFSINEGGAIP